MKVSPSRNRTSRSYLRLFLQMKPAQYMGRENGKNLYTHGRHFQNRAERLYPRVWSALMGRPGYGCIRLTQICLCVPGPFGDGVCQINSQTGWSHQDGRIVLICLSNGTSGVVPCDDRENKEGEDGQYRMEDILAWMMRANISRVPDRTLPAGGPVQWMMEQNTDGTCP